MKDLNWIDKNKLEKAVEERLESMKESFLIVHKFSAKEAVEAFMTFLNKFSEDSIDAYLSLIEEKSERTRIMTGDNNEVKYITDSETEKYFIMSLNAIRVCEDNDCVMVHGEILTKKQALEDYQNPKTDELKKSDFEEDEEELPRLEDSYEM